jgi:hypothetical protein
MDQSVPRPSPRPNAISASAVVPVGATRIGGIDINRPRARATLAAALAVAVAPQGFTVAQFTPPRCRQ